MARALSGRFDGTQTTEVKGDLSLQKKIASSMACTGLTALAIVLLAGCGTSNQTTGSGTSNTSGTSSTSNASGTSNTSTTTASTNNTSSSTSSNKVVNITFWNGHPSGALKKQMHQEVAEFNSTHPNIHVSYIDKYSDIQPVTAAFAAGDAPNVAMPHQNEAVKFAQSGYLVDLTPYMQSSTNGLSQSDIQNDYYPAVWNSTKITNDGKQYLLPYEESVQMVIYYNEALLKKAGIASPPKTWAEVQTDAQKISALGSGDHGIAWTPSIYKLFILTEDFGGKVFTDSSKTSFALNNQGAQQALTMLRNMVKDKSLLLTQKYGFQLDFGTGKVGMLIDSSAGYTYDVKAAGGKFKVGATPAPTASANVAHNIVEGDTLAVFNTGTQAQKQAAWTFVKWLSSPKINSEWNQATNYVPTGPVSANLMKSFYSSNPNYAASFSDPKGWMTAPFNATAYDAATTAMMSDFQKALLGQESPSQALQNMTKIGNEYMSGKKKG